MASQKVEEYSKENSNWKTNNWQQNENDRNGHYQDFNQENRGWNSSTGIGQFKTGSSSWDDWDNNGTRREEPAKGSSLQSTGYNSSSWDDWDHKDPRKEEPAKGSAPHNNDGWAGWDDGKDDGYDHFYESASNKKAVDHNGKSDSTWTEGGFL